MHQNGNVEPVPVVSVVDNDPAARNSLAWFIESADLTVETFETAEAFLEAYRPERPGCLILDVRLPGMSGLLLQDELRRADSPLPIIMITGYADVPTAVRVLKQGAFDFIEKPLSDEVLLERIRQAIAWDANQRRVRAARETLMARLACLTAREREVFDQVVIGKANKVVAYEFGISEKTVEAHRARVMQKLGAGSLAELVRIDLAASQVDPWLMARLSETAAAASRAASRHASL